MFTAELKQFEDYNPCVLRTSRFNTSWCWLLRLSAAAGKKAVWKKYSGEDSRQQEEYQATATTRQNADRLFVWVS